MLIALLTGCESTASSPVCPVPKEYSAKEQDTAADELAALPKGSVIAKMIAQYGVLRAQARACKTKGNTN